LIVFWTVMLRRIHREATTPETKLTTDKYTLMIGMIHIFFVFF
jgi:hypothetical protein